MIRKGEAWERPASGAPERTVRGTDADLAAAVRDRPGVRLAFDPEPVSDLARALGIHPPIPGVEPTIDVTVDAMRVEADGHELYGVNLLVVGTAPDRLTWFSRRLTADVQVDGRVVHQGPATALVVASGQYLRGADVVPRGHPGDGRLEVQVYAPHRGEARQVRDRLAQGAHLPHPHIQQGTGRRIEITTDRPAPLELDGLELPPASRVVVEVVPGAFTLVL
jgi:hypothetical protein